MHPHKNFCIHTSNIGAAKAKTVVVLATVSVFWPENTTNRSLLRPPNSLNTEIGACSNTNSHTPQHSGQSITSTMHPYVQCEPLSSQPPQKPKIGPRQRQRKRAHELKQQSYGKQGASVQTGPRQNKQAKKSSLTPHEQSLSNFHKSPGGARPHSSKVVTPKEKFGSTTAHAIAQLLRPRHSVDLQHPLRLITDQDGLSAIIDNSLITGKISTANQAEETFLLYLTVSANERAGTPTSAVRELLRRQIATTLPNAQQQNSIDDAEIVPVTDDSEYFILDGLPAATTDATLSPMIQKCTHFWLLTLEPDTAAAQALLYLAGGQAEWNTSLATIATNPKLSEADAKLLKTQPVLVKRAYKASPPKTPEPATLHSDAFRGKCVDTSLRHFQEAAIFTLHRNLTDPTHRRQNTHAASLEQLSQPVQALLQRLDAMQPATNLTSDAAKTISFHPVNTGTLFLTQTRPVTLDLKHPDTPNKTETYTFYPPRLKSKQPGHLPHDQYRRRGILMQSKDDLYIHPAGSDGQLPDHWPRESAREGLHSGHQYMEETMSEQPIDDEQIETLLEIDIAPDLSTIQSHPRWTPTSTMKTAIIISPQDPKAYALLATLTETVTVTHATKIQWRGDSKHQVSEIRFNPDSKSVLGKHYVPLLTSPETHKKFPHLRPLRYDKNRGVLLGSRADKIKWAMALLEENDLLDEFDIQDRKNKKQQRNDRHNKLPLSTIEEKADADTADTQPQQQEAEMPQADAVTKEQQQKIDEACKSLADTYSTLNAAMESYKNIKAALVDAQAEEVRLLTEVTKAQQNKSPNLDSITDEWSTAHDAYTTAKANEQTAAAAAVEATGKYRLDRKVAESAFAKANLPLPDDFPPPALDDGTDPPTTHPPLEEDNTGGDNDKKHTEDPENLPTASGGDPSDKEGSVLDMELSEPEPGDDLTSSPPKQEQPKTPAPPTTEEQQAPDASQHPQADQSPGPSADPKTDKGPKKKIAVTPTKQQRRTRSSQSGGPAND